MARTEQRQHLNLSNHAYATVTTDMAAFEERGTLSGFVNRIVESFYEEAEATIPLAMERKQAEYVELAKRARYRVLRPGDAELKNFVADNYKLTNADMSTIGLLVSEHGVKLVQEMNSFPRDVAKKVRLNNYVYDLVYPEEGEEWIGEGYYECQGDYLKAVVEEYAHKPFFEREAIIFSDLIRKVEQHCMLPDKEKHILRVTLIAGPDGVSPAFDMKLYGIMADAASNYHYVVGLTRPVNDPEALFSPGCFRLSRIDTLKEKGRSYGSGRLTEKERKQLQAQIKDRGVEYLVEGRSTQKVRLTPNGAGLYKRILHMRPVAIAQEEQGDGSVVMTFNCTGFQIKNYFRRFGAEAVVIEPYSLAREIRDEYRAALAAYDEG